MENRGFRKKVGKNNKFAIFISRKSLLETPCAAAPEELSSKGITEATIGGGCDCNCRGNSQDNCSNKSGCGGLDKKFQICDGTGTATSKCRKTDTVDCGAAQTDCDYDVQACDQKC